MFGNGIGTVSTTLCFGPRVAAVFFFGFLRSGEITVRAAGEYDPQADLSFGDVTLNHRENPTVAQIRIKASKTDPFRKGVNIYMGATGNDLCPVTAIAAYLAVRRSAPFFQLEGGRPLTREAFVERVRAALTVAGLNASQFAGHSFRSGAATTAAERGIEDSLIKILGRWKSSAYLLYLKIPPERLAGLSSALASS